MDRRRPLFGLDVSPVRSAHLVGPSNVGNVLEFQLVGSVFGSVIIAVVTDVSLVEAVGQYTRMLENHDCLPLLLVTLKHSQLNLVVRVLATERYLQQISCESEIRRQSSDEELLTDGTILVFHVQYMGRTVSSETEGYSRTWFLTPGLK